MPPPRVMRFSCPSCYAYLELDPAYPYHGQPAPCPFCQALIVPPRVHALPRPVPGKVIRPVESAKTKHRAGVSKRTTRHRRFGPTQQ